MFKFYFTNLICINFSNLYLFILFYHIIPAWYHFRFQNEFRRAIVERLDNEDRPGEGTRRNLYSLYSTKVPWPSIFFTPCRKAGRGLGEGRSFFGDFATEGDAREELQYCRHNRGLQNSSKHYLQSSLIILILNLIINLHREMWRLV